MMDIIWWYQSNGCSYCLVHYMNPEVAKACPYHGVVN